MKQNNGDKVSINVATAASSVTELEGASARPNTHQQLRGGYKVSGLEQEADRLEEVVIDQAGEIEAVWVK